MASIYFNEEHKLFRNTIRQFVENEILPYTNEWEKQETIPRALFARMGELGFLGINFPEEYGGSNSGLFHTAVYLEELGRSGLAGVFAAVSVHQYMATAHILNAGSEALKEKYVIPAVEGKKVGALAISEPHVGSDVAGIKTRAVKEGDHYVINGSKTFITNGVHGDFVTLAVKTDPEAGVNGISLIVVDQGTAGFSTNKLDKMGWKSSDTGELFFDDVMVPASNLIGEENRGFFYIMESFQIERLVAALGAIGGADGAIEMTMNYMKERSAFGRPISKFQALRHRMADLLTELESARAFTYHTTWLVDQGEFAVKECSMAKLLTTELGKKIADECIQFYGGYGYMEEYPIARMYRDARVGTIVGGTSEIMREIISKMAIDDTSYKPVYQKRATTDSSIESIKLAASETNIEESIEMPAMSKKPETAEEIIGSLETRFKPESASGVNCTFHFDISGDNGGKFTVNIKEGKCIVTDGHEGKPDCVVKTKDKTYEDVELGRSNPQMAVMMGKIKISNLGEMMKFISYFHRV